MRLIPVRANNRVMTTRIGALAPLAGTPAPGVTLTFPGNYGAVQQSQPISFAALGGIAVGNALYMQANGPTLSISKHDGSNFAVGNALGVIFTVLFEIE